MRAPSPLSNGNSAAGLCPLRGGFTLLETVVSVGIIALFATMAAVNFQQTTQRLSLQTAAREVIDTLHEARSKTLASVAGSSYGIHFDTNTYTLFSGTAYEPGSPTNIVRSLPDTVELYTNTLTDDTVLYARVRGTTDSSGTIGLRLVNDPSATLTIAVPVLGVASSESSVATTNERITDTRHVHFDLGWSIQGATTLLLTFHDSPNPDTELVVAMGSYFAADGSNFNWEGSASVNEESQTLHVHTHSLDAFNTVLSVHRDGRRNTKAVDIAIDGQQIATYDALGTMTVGIAGGTATIQ